MSPRSASGRVCLSCRSDARLVTSVGVLDPTWAKTLVLVDPEGVSVALVAIDAIGADGELMRLAYTYAANMGFTIPEANVIFGVSHTHSGPGGMYNMSKQFIAYSLPPPAVSPSFLWQFAPAVGMMMMVMPIIH